ncbi:helix-turn-helix domain-containing protein [Nocardioides sp. NPDC047086]|uniref:helix-turn-helix transcriptional regulator n=1 Tax=Nocardioides sp. NPDC047086 TaxID=3154810 RepID=UPI0033D98408
MNTSTPTGDLEPLLCVEELSDYLDVPIKTLYEWHQAGKGPCAVRVGRRLRYMVCDVRTWLAAQRTDTPQRRRDGEATDTDRHLR